MSANITNIVVLMLENRSYDNVLGKLYDPSYAAPYNQAPPGQADLRGLTGSESNYDPVSCKPIQVAAATGDRFADPPLIATTIPTIDPGEPFADMAQQILGLESVPTSGNPYTNPPGRYGMMGGFVANYCGQSSWGTKSVPAQAMMHMTPTLMPITAFLANRYMVCDGWYGSAPTQTFANRLYSLCGESGSWRCDGIAYSYIDDDEYLGIEHDATAVYNDKPPAWFAPAHSLHLPSIFQQLDTVLGVTQTSPDGKISASWKLYFHDYSLTSCLLGYVHQRFIDENSLNLGQYDHSDYTADTTHLANKKFTTFAEDLAQGTLAPFTLIEPRYSNDYKGAASGNQVNCNHPGRQGYPPITWGCPFIDAYYGELLLQDIYTKLRNSSYWPGTLLIVIYDEHGGCYDHLPPIQDMTPPHADTPNSYVGFDFKVSGPRVPALIISPFAEAGSTLRAADGKVFDHTSVIKTVWDCFNLGRKGASGLTDRDAAAASILQGLSATAVNDTGIPPTPRHP